MSSETVETAERTAALTVEEPPPAAAPEPAPTTRDEATPAAEPTDAISGPAGPTDDAGDSAPDPEPAPDPAARDREPSGESAGEVALAILRAHYGLLRAHEVAVERTDDPESLHDLRVDVRRLRAALELFADALPKRAAVHRERLGELGSVLGALRDLDVQSARVAGWMASASRVERDTLEQVAAALDERRRQARRRAVTALASKRTRRSFERLERLLESGPPKGSSTARTPILSLALELLTHEHRKLVVIGDSIGPGSPAEALHAVRMRCKRLRYAVESFKPWYGRPTRAYAERLVPIEDVLGTHQDAIVAAEALRAIGMGSRQMGAAELLTLGALAERCLQQARDARALFPGRFAKVSGRRWRQLVRRMEDARSAGS